MAKIKTYDYNSAENSITVTYESGVVRRYSVDRLPKSLQAFVLEPVEETVPAELPKPEETEKSDDVPEVSETETPAPAETPEKSYDVTEVPEPETYPSLETIISEIPFDLKIKPLCRKCKLLGSCYNKHPSKVLEDLSNNEYCYDFCGECTVCCSDYKPLIAFPETPAPAETPEKSDDVTEVPEPETYPSLETIISEIPFDLKIKPLCRKCKHLGICYTKHPSKVLEEVYRREPCDDYDIFDAWGECGVGCICCCSDYKPLIEFSETSIKLSDDELNAILYDDDVPF